MSADTRYVLTVAGLDPTAGAGLLADIKTIEHVGCYGFAVCTALTYQTDRDFYGVRYSETAEIREQLLPVVERFPLSAVKIGLTQDIFSLRDIVFELKALLPEIPIVWDPVLQSSSGYVFHDSINMDLLHEVLSRCAVITPNRNEVLFLSDEKTAEEAAESLSLICPVLLKGGHVSETSSGDAEVSDSLYTRGSVVSFCAERLRGPGKHGSGCVHSSALASYLAQGDDLPLAAKKAFWYMQSFLKTGEGLLGRQLESGVSQTN